MSELNKQIKAMDDESFNQIYESVFGLIRNRFQKDFTLFDTHATTLLDILSQILADSDELKELFINTRYQGVAWIPGPGGINLTKGIGSCTGDLLEQQSVLGPYFSLSYLPTTINLKGDTKFVKMSEKVENELR